MDLIFVDNNPLIVETYRQIIGSPSDNRANVRKNSLPRTYCFVCCDINNAVDPKYPVDYIVSPANSYGIMNGGIDEVFMLMFPGIQREVQAAIKIKYPETKLLPVGKCLSVPITKMRRCKNPIIKELICCPTMEEPCDIRGTDNVFQALKALLLFLNTQARPLKVVIPGLGTSTGRLSPEESAHQIKLALNSF